MFLESRKQTADFLQDHSQFIHMTWIPNVTQYFKPLLHLSQHSTSTANAIFGSNFDTYSLHIFFPHISVFPSITDKATSVC